MCALGRAVSREWLLSPASWPPQRLPSAGSFGFRTIEVGMALAAKRPVVVNSNHHACESAFDPKRTVPHKKEWSEASNRNV